MNNRLVGENTNKGFKQFLVGGNTNKGFKMLRGAGNGARAGRVPPWFMSAQTTNFFDNEQPHLGPLGRLKDIKDRKD